MLEKNYYYPGQESSEEHRLFLRRHWFAYIKWIIILLLLVIIPIILIIIGLNTNFIDLGGQYRRTFVVIGAIYTMFLMTLFLTTWIDHYLDVTIVTKKNLINIKQNELFSRSIAEQSLLRVQDVTVKKNGFLQTYFNFGTVFVETAGEQPNFRMTDIEDPVVVAETIMRLHEEIMLNSGNFDDELSAVKKQKNNKQTNTEIKKSDDNSLIKRDDKISLIDNDSTDKKEIIDNQYINNDDKIITLQTPKEKTTNNNIGKDNYTNKIDEKNIKSDVIQQVTKKTTDDKNVLDDVDNKIKYNDKPDTDENTNFISNEQPDVENQNTSNKGIIEGELKEGEEIQL